jgi:predicted RecB family nuclease
MTSSGSSRLTAQLLADFLQCNTKGQLLWRTPQPKIPHVTHSFRNEIKLGSADRAEHSTGRHLISFDELSTVGLSRVEGRFLVDCDTAYVDLSRVDVSHRTRKGSKSVDREPFAPILFVVDGSIQNWHKALLCFSAIAISNLGQPMPSIGYVSHGYDREVSKIRISTLVTDTVRILIEAQETLSSKQDVPLELKSHCSLCEFKMRCRQVAIETDNLSLIGTLSEKERRRLREKGINTVTQLSYGYRPRRKRRTMARGGTEGAAIRSKNDNKLRALAIKKQQIHVLGAPQVTRRRTPVYLDVEGFSGGHFYYLIGMRFKIGDDWKECSSWADTRQDECRIWSECLRQLAVLESPQIIHFGSYEANFLKRMKERYPALLPNPEFVDELLSHSCNLVSLIFGTIYFPTFTNGLKDIAQYLGFRWTNSEASGAVAPLWRSCWDLSFDESIKSELVRYNIEDCRAAEIVDSAVQQICGMQDVGSSVSFVNVSTLEVPYQRTFGPFAGALPDFQKINDAAYWDYQREKVFVRTIKQLRRKQSGAKRRARIAVRRPDRIMRVAGIIPPSCARCSSTMIRKAGCQSQTIADIIFSKRGIRRQITRYEIQRYRCRACDHEMGTPRQKTIYGVNLRAYIIYLLIEMRLSHTNIAEHFGSVFGLRINPSTINDIKSSMASEYESLYRSLLLSISKGAVVHADETKGVVYPGGHYMWIFTNLTTVGYVYWPTRDGDVLRDVLNGFSGVLISDFYGAYDSIECAQQKCLIHLMRDINDLVLKNPFNSEVRSIASAFGVLLRGIVDSIDKWGLKARRLRRHKHDVDRFFSKIESSTVSSEAALSLNKRFVKNRRKLFTFLDYDGVPWNNNNAEHAVRAFTRIRNCIATSTVKGTKEYAILLSIQQTLKYRNIEFLDFLRSGRKDIESLHEQRALHA